MFDTLKIDEEKNHSSNTNIRIRRWKKKIMKENLKKK